MASPHSISVFKGEFKFANYWDLQEVVARLITLRDRWIDRSSSGQQVLFDEQDVTYVPPNLRNIVLFFRHLHSSPSLCSRQCCSALGQRQKKTLINSRWKRCAVQVSWLWQNAFAAFGGSNNVVALHACYNRSTPAVDSVSVDRNLRETPKYAILDGSKTHKTAIHVTHDQSEAFCHSDRIVVDESSKN